MMATEKRLDLIDRKNLIKAVEKKQFAIGDNTHPYEAIRIQGKYFREVVEGALTVDAVEVVHGRWENGDCTACGFDIRDLIDGDSDFRGWVWEGLPYCPNCGAKMDGDGNG